MTTPTTTKSSTSPYHFQTGPFPTRMTMYLTHCRWCVLPSLCRATMTDSALYLHRVSSGDYDRLAANISSLNKHALNTVVILNVTEKTTSSRRIAARPSRSLLGFSERLPGTMSELFTKHPGTISLGVLQYSSARPSLFSVSD